MNFQQLMTRRTIRRFQQTPLPKEDLRFILQAAQMASCAANLQRLRYAVVTNAAMVHEILPHTAYAKLVHPQRQPIAGVNSPMAFIAISANCEIAPILHADAGAAIQSMEFAAWERGIGSCWIGSVERPPVAKILGMAYPERILYLLALGYPAEHPVADSSQSDSVRYYLDGHDVLHVPKLPLDMLVSWHE